MAKATKNAGSSKIEEKPVEDDEEKDDEESEEEERKEKKKGWKAIPVSTEDKQELARIMLLKYKDYVDADLLDKNDNCVNVARRNNSKKGLNDVEQAIYDKYNMPPTEDRDAIGTVVKDWVIAQLDLGRRWASIKDQVAQALPKARQTYEAENSGIPDDQIPPRPVRDGSPVQLAGLERDEET